MTANPIATYPQSSGGAGAASLLATQTLASTTLAVTFSALSQSYTNLLVVMSGLTAAGSPQNVSLNFNGDVGSDYSYIFVAGNGAAATSAQVSNTTAIQIAQFENAGGSIARFFVAGYKSSNAKTVEGTYMYFNAGFGNEITTVAGIWQSGAAITSLTLSCGTPGFAAGTIVSIYGLS